MSLAERLKEAREEKGWKKVDLKNAAKLKSASTLTELEKGKITESPQIPAIANALGVEVMWLKYGKGAKYPSPASALKLSPAALQIAVAANSMSPEHQAAWLHVITIDAVKQSDASLTEIQKLGEEKPRSTG